MTPQTSPPSFRGMMHPFHLIGRQGRSYFRLTRRALQFRRSLTLPRSSASPRTPARRPCETLSLPISRAYASLVKGHRCTSMRQIIGPSWPSGAADDHYFSSLPKSDLAWEFLPRHPGTSVLQPRASLRRRRWPPSARRSPFSRFSNARRLRKIGRCAPFAEPNASASIALNFLARRSSALLVAGPRTVCLLMPSNDQI